MSDNAWDHLVSINDIHDHGVYPEFAPWVELHSFMFLFFNLQS
nr:MAG TPA: hypothetical protein [Bacteriophage sp.]